MLFYKIITGGFFASFDHGTNMQLPGADHFGTLEKPWSVGLSRMCFVRAFGICSFNVQQIRRISAGKKHWILQDSWGLNKDLRIVFVFEFASN